MHFNFSYLNKLKPHENPKCVKRNINLILLNIELDFCAWGLQGLGLHVNRTRSSIPNYRQKKRVLSIQPRRHSSDQNIEMCIGRWTEFFTIGKNITNEIVSRIISLRNSTIDCIYIARARRNTKQLFNSSTDIF